MFTGIVEEVGRVTERLDRPDVTRLRVSAPLVTGDARRGGSIAVDGVCLTVVDVADGAFSVDVIGETLLRSGLGGLAPGDRVNLERAVPAGGRLGGHLVQGHVDGTGTIISREPAEYWDLVRFALPSRLARYVVEKGSIAVDGVSLTVVEAGPDWFTVGLIPTTLELTTLAGKQPGEGVNLEVDVLAKYVERLLWPHLATPAAALRDNGSEQGGPVPGGPGNGPGNGPVNGPEEAP